MDDILEAVKPLLLLIAPEGIEMRKSETNDARKTNLLIAPEGIEIIQTP